MMQESLELNESPAGEECPELLSKDLVIAVAALSEWLDERTRVKRALLRVRRALETLRSGATEGEVARIEAAVDGIAERLGIA